MAEHDSFKGYGVSLFNIKVGRHGIEYVLENLEGDNLNKDLLKERYDEFWPIY